jgi:hypothetical protein
VHANLIGSIFSYPVHFFRWLCCCKKWAISIYDFSFEESIKIWAFFIWDGLFFLFLVVITCKVNKLKYCDEVWSLEGIGVTVELWIGGEIFSQIMDPVRDVGSVVGTVLIPTRFVWPYGGRSVFLSGSFTRCVCLVSWVWWNHNDTASDLVEALKCSFCQIHGGMLWFY